MNKVDTYQFWKRIDSLRDVSISEISKISGINYQRLKEQRSSQRLPCGEDLLSISKALNVSIEFLLTGHDVFSPRIYSIAKKMDSLTEAQLDVIESAVDASMEKSFLSAKA